MTQLKLLAKDHEDLEIISAHLQDAVVHLSSLQYHIEEKKFTLLSHRFCWDPPPINENDQELYHRTHAGLTFHHVEAVHYKGFDRKNPEHHKIPLNLLMLHHPQEDFIHLIFSGLQEIRLKIKELYCHLTDIDEPWVTPKKPTHLEEHLDAMHKS